MKLVNLLQDTQEKLLNIYFCCNESFYEAKILLNNSFDASEFSSACQTPLKALNANEFILSFRYAANKTFLQPSFV